MFRPKRFMKTVFAAGVLGVSIVLTQCTSMSTPLSAQDVTAGPVATRTAAATQTQQAINNLPAEVAVATITPTVPTLSPTPDAPILEPGGPGAATNLLSEVECARPGLAVAKLTWTPASDPGSAQRVDVTIYSFDTKYDSSVLLPPDQASLVWDQLRGQAIHDWRVLTLQANGWVPSETAGFVGPTCLLEIQEEEETPVIR